MAIRNGTEVIGFHQNTCAMANIYLNRFRLWSGSIVTSNVYLKCTDARLPQGRLAMVTNSGNERYFSRMTYFS